MDGRWRGVPEGEAAVRQGSRGQAHTQGSGKPADESERHEGSRQDCDPSARPRAVELDKRERIFFTHSDPHGAATQHGRFLTGMPDDDSLQRPIVA